MKHAAHGASARRGTGVGSRSTGRSSGITQAAGIEGLDDALAAKLNEVAPRTRRSIRLAAKASARRSHIMTGSALTVLVGAAASSMAVSQARGDWSLPLADSVAINLVTPSSSTGSSSATGGARVSRSDYRQPLPTASQRNEGSWELGESELDAGQMSKSLANNPVVAVLMDANRSVLPAGFNPNHAPGATVVSAADDALELARQEAIPDDGMDRSEIWIIGGAGVFSTFFPLADAAYVTDLDLRTPADVFVPDMEELVSKRFWQVRDESRWMTPAKPDQADAIRRFRYITYGKVR